MLGLEAVPPLDKRALIGGCLRLPVYIDIERLCAEIDVLPADIWNSQGGRVAVHRDAGAVFLRGYAPKEGDKPIEDRPALDFLPYAREIIETMFGSKPSRCLMARLAGGGIVTQHIDIGAYFDRTIRIHVPVVSNPRAWMVCNGLSYVMAPGEAWALNNSTMHAVWNDCAEPRTHMICDYFATPELLSLLGRAERNLGVARPDVDRKVSAETQMRMTGG